MGVENITAILKKKKEKIDKMILYMDSLCENQRGIKIKELDDHYEIYATFSWYEGDKGVTESVSKAELIAIAVESENVEKMKDDIDKLIAEKIYMHEYH